MMLHGQLSTEHEVDSRLVLPAVLSKRINFPSSPDQTPGSTPHQPQLHPGLTRPRV